MNSPFKNIYLLFFIVQCFSNFIKYQFFNLYLFLFYCLEWDETLYYAHQNRQTPQSHEYALSRGKFFFTGLSTQNETSETICAEFILFVFLMFFLQQTNFFISLANHEIWVLGRLSSLILFGVALNVKFSCLYDCLLYIH